MSVVLTDDLFRYADKFARKGERNGCGTKYPTVAQAAKRFRCRQVDIQDASEGYTDLGYLALARYNTFNDPPLGEWLVEAYK
jgi:hypothetical protein